MRKIDFGRRINTRLAVSLVGQWDVMGGHRMSVGGHGRSVGDHWKSVVSRGMLV